MKGSILIYDNDTKRGVILDSQNNEYDFHIGEWLSEKPIVMSKEAIDICIKERNDVVKSFFSHLLKKWGI